MRNPDRETVFKFKQFEVVNRDSAMKVGTDGVLLGAWSLMSEDSKRSQTANLPLKILDAGCGTGVISLMMAQRFPSALIYGVEIDPNAARETDENFKRSPWVNRLSVIQGDFKEMIHDNNKFDLIVSNPPFFTNGQLSPDNARLTARHESSLSLNSLLSVSSHILSASGVITLILPSDRESDLKISATLNHLHIVRLTTVSTVPRKPPRRLLAELSLRPCDSIRLSNLSIHDETGCFSKEYSNLVKDFYLKF